jgi:hypothetical protein
VVNRFDCNWISCLRVAIEILGFDIGGGSCVGKLAPIVAIPAGH